jgi:hypothetical protein
MQTPRYLDQRTKGRALVTGALKYSETYIPRKPL